MSGTTATEDDGKDRVTAVFYDGRSVNVETLPSLDSVAEYLKIHSGAQVWISTWTTRDLDRWSTRWTTPS